MRFPSLKSIFYVLTAIFALGMIALLGAEWELQWSLDTGRQRTIQRICGFQTSVSQPEETIISEWRRAEMPDGNWQKVASGSNRSTPLLTYSYSRITGHFRALQQAVPITEDQTKFAEFVLNEIATGNDLSSVSRSCYDVRQSVLELSGQQFFEEQPVSFEQLILFWKTQNLKD